MLTIPVDGIIKQKVAAYNAVSCSDTAFLFSGLCYNINNLIPYLIIINQKT